MPNNRGGARPGAGRPFGTKRSQSKIVQFRLYPEQIEVLEKLVRSHPDPKANKSLIIREMIDTLKEGKV